MKKILFLMLGMAALLTSCSQREDLPIGNGGAEQVKFSLTADGQAQTRAAGDMRYVLAVYDHQGTTEVIAETEFSTSTFAVRLDPGQYTCLFWADHGEDNYDAADLKSVALKSSATEAEAFYAKQVISVTTGQEVSVTLNRAVAKVVLKETDQLKPGSIAVTYNGCQGFDVESGSATDDATVTKTLPIATTINGSVVSPAEVGSFLMLAGKDGKTLIDFKLKYNAEAEKTISNVPVQANYVTNISGKFSVNANQQFSVSLNDTWATQGYEADLPPYVTFSAQSSQKFSMKDNGMGILKPDEYFEYSVGGGQWVRFTYEVSDIAFGGGRGNLRLRGKSSQGTAANALGQCFIISFDTNRALVDCRGDIRTLIDYENYETADTYEARFQGLFRGNDRLKSAPALPSTTLAGRCYLDMFSGCTSLTEAPALPATTLAQDCYMSMFAGCTSLTTAPALPATTLAEWCYTQMFKGCTSLTTAPTLPATTLTSVCYRNMFDGCTKLSEVKMSATDISAQDCLYRWLYNAGTEATSRTLTLANQSIYNAIEAGIPDIWKSGQATITYTNP